MNETKSMYGHNVIEYKNLNIYIIEGIFDDDSCKDIISIIDKSIVNINNKRNYSGTNNVLCYAMELDQLIDNDDTLYYKFSTNTNEYQSILNDIACNDIKYKNKNNGENKKAFEDIKNNIIKKINKIRKIMNTVDKNIKLAFSSPIELRKIFGETRLHTDGILHLYESNITYVNKGKRYNDSKLLVRNLSMVCALNEDYEGGVFNFPNQNITFKLKRGSVILFPPYWTHPHEVSELLNYTNRYTINSWFCEYSNATVRDSSIIGYN
jgi:hypothetical protein